MIQTHNANLFYSVQQFIKKMNQQNFLSAVVCLWLSTSVAGFQSLRTNLFPSYSLLFFHTGKRHTKLQKENHILTNNPKFILIHWTVVYFANPWFKKKHTASEYIIPNTSQNWQAVQSDCVHTSKTKWSDNSWQSCKEWRENGDICPSPVSVIDASIDKQDCGYYCISQTSNRFSASWLRGRRSVTPQGRWQVHTDRESIGEWERSNLQAATFVLRRNCNRGAWAACRSWSSCVNAAERGGRVCIHGYL